MRQFYMVMAYVKIPFTWFAIVIDDDDGNDDNIGGSTNAADHRDFFVVAVCLLFFRLSFHLQNKFPATIGIVFLGPKQTVCIA